ncbi:ethanolamine ammonia-lyase subunit EutC [Oceanobacter mangrovi]|uniref:ethanolamine ammonia-lyase subunit EutC n=1 Tax=Oceanobacter mangrovi TaxID=2862510 RepID=UPI001C8D746F|nr:ethanolamine ammonia-lyase subunit EutC [Oceanobacter mangrovi]
MNKHCNGTTPPQGTSSEQRLAANDSPVTDNPWESLRRFTDARIGLGRAGISVPTKHLMEFQLAHARAQDAVHSPLPTEQLIDNLIQQPWCPAGIPFQLHSQADSRAVYLQRPDLGRQLNSSSQQLLQDHHKPTAKAEPYDLAIAIVDGLSSRAIEDNCVPFLSQLIPALTSHSNPWSIAPLALVEQGRVAIGDHVGELLKARCVLVLVGERPGLSSPDSMGLYLTWNPQVGRTDAWRNCISNVRPAGLKYPDAVRKTLYLMEEARAREVSGVQLKDRTDDSVLEQDGSTPSHNHNFLISHD